MYFQEEKWNEQERDERRINFIPQKFSNLRSVPAYSRFINERFERCLDLYLCPRQRKMRVIADDKITSENSLKTFNINCKMLKNQELEGKQFRSRWDAVSPGSTVFANSAIVVFGSLQVKKKNNNGKSLCYQIEFEHGIYY